MKRILSIAAVTLGMLVAVPAAQAGGVDLSIGIGIPGVVFGGPPVYYAPPPVYYAPPPPPVVVVPQAVYGPPAGYYYGGRADKHAEKRWRKHQKQAWKAYRNGYYRD